MVELRQEVIFVSHSVTLGLSTVYILAYILTTALCNRASNSKGHDVPTISLENVGGDS